MLVLLLYNKVVLTHGAVVYGVALVWYDIFQIYIYMWSGIAACVCEASTGRTSVVPFFLR